VLLSSLGYSPSGECFYVDGHEVATTAAESIPAEKLIFMMNETTLQDSRKKRIKFLTLNKAQALLKRRKSMDAQVRRYIEHAINACLSQVQRVHLLSVNVAGALLQELYSHDGAGTLISAERYDDIHAATIEHVGGIINLIKPLEEQGTLVPRTRDQIELAIHQYDVIERDGFVIACGSLHPIKDKNTGEIACLAVHPDFQKEGYGSRLLKHLEDKAWSNGIHKLFILTTKALHWFPEHGYKKSNIKDLPIAKQKSYNYQRNSQIYIKTANK
jgi:amino-acid N-acetyltransferase